MITHGPPALVPFIMRYVYFSEASSGRLFILEELDNARKGSASLTNSLSEQFSGD